MPKQSKTCLEEFYSRRLCSGVFASLHGVKKSSETFGLSYQSVMYWKNELELGFLRSFHGGRRYLLSLNF
jgi:hypothetical protein